MTGKVIEFETFKDRREKEIVGDADDIIYGILDELLNMMESVGVERTDEEVAKDIYLIMESVRSLVYRERRIDHPFQKLVDDNVETVYNEETDNYLVYWKHELPELIKKKVDTEDDS